MDRTNQSMRRISARGKVVARIFVYFGSHPCARNRSIYGTNSDYCHLLVSTNRERDDTTDTIQLVRTRAGEKIDPDNRNAADIGWFVPECRLLYAIRLPVLSIR